MRNTRKATILNKWVPLGVLDAVISSLGRRTRLTGRFSTWKDALRQSRGYTDNEVLNHVIAATRQILADGSKFERDGYVFDTFEFPFPLITTVLMGAQAAGGNVSVLDFGGSLGSSYYQCKSFLSDIQRLSWNIVEQQHFVERGKAEFQTDVLKFYHSVEEAASAQNPNVVLFSGVLQYLPDPYIVLKDVIEKSPEFIIVDRTPFVNRGSEAIAVQKVPAILGGASYPVRLFEKDKLMLVLKKNYSLLSSFKSVDIDLPYQGDTISFDGLIFRKIHD